PLQPADGVEQCCLAGTVGADQPGDLAGFDADADVIDRGVAAESDRDATDFKQWHWPLPCSAALRAGGRASPALGRACRAARRYTAPRCPLVLGAWLCDATVPPR